MATVEDILMQKGPDVTVACSTMTVRDATRLMSRANVGSVVIRDGEEVHGIFTERDLLRRMVAKGLNPDTTSLSQVMSTPVVSCGISDDLDTCKRLLTDKHIRHLTVIEGGALVGLIGFRDILRIELGV